MTIKAGIVMPFCPKCGKEVSPEASYCPWCGASLKVDKDLLREKIAEARHGELEAAIAGLAGVAIVLAGIYLASITERSVEWRGLIPYEVMYHPYADIAMLCMVGGFIALLAALIGEIYYWRKRSRLMKQLESLRG
jgi:hypothetical protein